MKRRITLALAVSLLVIVVSLLLAETLTVKVQSTSVRNNPKFYAASVQVIRAGEKVEKIAAQGGWLQVRTAGGAVGWIHSSAVEVQKFDLMAMGGGVKTQAAAGEAALAAKGFNKQVEDSFRAKNRDVSFVWVDKMLQIKISPSQVEEFMKAGKLGEFRGAR
ncbi:MAG: SH3 domain-containing protein [Acidobacteriota bacterium]